jgi:hypothetical protein
VFASGGRAGNAASSRAAIAQKRDWNADTVASGTRLYPTMSANSIVRSVRRPCPPSSRHAEVGTPLAAALRVA